jgi:hypothetical protein
MYARFGPFSQVQGVNSSVYEMSSVGSNNKATTCQIGAHIVGINISGDSNVAAIFRVARFQYSLSKHWRLMLAEAISPLLAKVCKESVVRKGLRNQGAIRRFSARIAPFLS